MLAAAATVAAAQGQYPSRAVRIVVPYPPGAITDTLPRLIAEKLKDEWGQPVIIENRAGAGGQLATEHVAKSPADGYTLLVALPDTVVIAPLVYRKLRYDPSRELAPVTLMARQAFVLVTRQDVPIGDIAELTRFAKANPGKLRLSSWGEGSAGHLALELFKSVSGTDLLHVPYKGAQAAMTDLLGGQVELMFTGYSTAGPHVKGGKLRVLGRTAATRSALTPEITTIAESGYPDYDVQSWYGLMAPAGTPRQVIDFIQRAVVKAAAAPEIRARIAGFYAESTSGTVEEFAALLKAENQKWSTVIRGANIQLD
jgi:tripartite-type tricarboxylate transporter receptor subunit TctC